jgi:hypothetical protein
MHSLPPTPQHTYHAVETLAMIDDETGSELQEQRGGQSLGKDINELGGRKGVEDANISNGDALTDKVEINLQHDWCTDAVGQGWWRGILH